MRRISQSLQNSRITFAAILLFGLLAITARPATDPDLWWHLRTGQWIVETGQVPHADPFSFTRAGAAWVSHEWLSEVLFYEIWRYTSWAGLIVLASLVTTAGFMVLYLRCVARPHWAAAAVALGAVASAPAWGVRPQMFTFLFASVLLWLIEQGEDHPWMLLWIPPIFLLWLNLHAGFALGPVLILAYCAGLGWETLSGETAWADLRGYLVRLLLVVAACAAAVPLNPSGFALYRYPLDVLRSGAMRSLIVEWASPDFHQARYAAFLLMCLGLLIAFARSETRPKARILVPLLGTLFAALDAVRHIPIFVLVALPVLAGGVPNISQRWDRENAKSRAGFQMAFRGVLVLFMAVFCVGQWGRLIRGQSRSEADLFPLAAVDFLGSHAEPDHLFAYYDWGGYSIWKLYPQYKVFVDGRADLYGDDVLEAFKAAIQLRTSWHEVLERWRVGTVLVPTGSALAQALQMDADWHTEYRDSQAVVFRRTVPVELKIGEEPGKPFPGSQKSAKILTRTHLNLRN